MPVYNDPIVAMKDTASSHTASSILHSALTRLSSTSDFTPTSLSTCSRGGVTCLVAQVVTLVGEMT